MKKYFLIITLIVFSVSNLFATHINGGSITYKKLSGNDYEIKLTVYRDCYNGVPGFDDPASVGFFDRLSHSLLNEVQLSTADSALVSVESDCVPYNVCLIRAVYTFTVTLPPSMSGYIISYQRCCRAAAIQNIANAGIVGITLFAEIPSNLIVNSSANFNHEVPSLGYVGHPFQFDASATDIDGDSLAYELESPYDGGSQNNPLPQPPSNPPFQLSILQPPFTLNNLIGGSPPLSFDSVSGLMTVTPTVAGVFQIAQKVKEYRNGSLINTSRREFMFYIAPGNILDLSGNTTVELATQNLDTGKVWLINLNLYDSTLTAVDTNLIISGSYNFIDEINGVYLVKASAEPNSLFYQDHIPTYHGDVLYWYDATHVDLCLNDTSGININLVKGQNPGGPGFVGGLISQGANRMSSSVSLGGITIILVNSFNQPVAYDITDASGTFNISNIPYGNYKVFVDRLSYYIDNALAPTINVSASTTQQFQFLMHNTWLEWIGFTNFDSPGTNTMGVFIYPNPTKNRLVVTSINKLICYKLTDTKGAIIKEEKLVPSKDFEITLEGIKQGVYFLHIKDRSMSIVRKVIKE